MQFIQVGMLGALGALAIPIIIHLMFRSRARPVDLGTLQFLKVVLRDNARRRRLKRWLLLALRMACLALDRASCSLGPTCSRPSRRGATGWSWCCSTARPAWGSRAERGRSIKRSTRRGRSWAEPARGHNWKSPRSARRFSPIAQPADLRTAAIEPTAAGTDYGAAMAWARDLLVRSRNGQARSCTSSPIFSARGSTAARP